MSDAKKITDNVATALSQAVAELTFCPAPEHRRIKSAFWALQNEGQFEPGTEIPLSLALRLTGDGRLSRWWPQPGFRDWFCNKDEFRQRLEYLSHLALDAAEEILLDRKANPGARVNMAKLVIEAANKMPQKYAREVFADEKINQMDKRQLQDYISRNSKLIGIAPKALTSETESATLEEPSK